MSDESELRAWFDHEQNKPTNLQSLMAARPEPGVEVSEIGMDVLDAIAALDKDLGSIQNALDAAQAMLANTRRSLGVKPDSPASWQPPALEPTGNLSVSEVLSVLCAILHVLPREQFHNLNHLLDAKGRGALNRLMNLLPKSSGG